MSEEKKPAIVIVTSETGRETRYAASAFGATADGALGVGSLLDDGSHEIKPVAVIAPGRWREVRLDGVTEPDDTATALGIARRTLIEVTRVSDGNVAIEFAKSALADLFDLGFE